MPRRDASRRGTHMATTDILIRPITERDVPALARLFPFPTPDRHHDRLAAQAAGEVAYLTAWDGATPVGHLLLLWGGTSDEPVAPLLRGCADIQDLFVAEERRSQGIGSRLLDEAERMARERGYRRIGLAVGIDNVRARALYERRGYADAGLGEYVRSGTFVDPGGREFTLSGTVVYLVKSP